MKLTNIYQANLDRMLESNSCIIKETNEIGTFIRKYNLIQGCYASKCDNGDFHYFEPYELENSIPRTIVKNADGTSHIERSERYITYRHYLIKCIELFEQEIGTNIINISDSKMIPVYIKNIFDKYKTKMDERWNMSLRLNSGIDLQSAQNKDTYISENILSRTEIEYNFINRFLTKLKKDFSVYLETKTYNKKKEKTLTLYDIWNCDIHGKKDQYHKTINELKRIGYIESVDTNLIWLKYPSSKGWVQHIAGFLATLNKQGWINDTYSAPKLKSIMSATFKISDFDHNPLKSLHSKIITEDLQKIFRFIPFNLR